MAKIINFLDKHLWILIILLSIPATWVLFVPGYYGASDDIHIAWLFELHKTLMMGQIPPRYVPDLSFGFGYPLFNFVFPLPFYLSEIFHILGLSLVDSIKTLFFITVPLSGLSMYFLLRQFVSKNLSLAGAILYIYTPYRSVDLYVRGAIGEIISFAILPLILLSIIKLEKSKNFAWVGVGAISLASLVLSHNITAYMFFPFVAFFFLLQIIFSASKWQLFVKTTLMVFLALLLSIYFWLPAIVDSSLVKYDTVFNFADHFPTLLQLIRPYWGYGASVPGPYDGISFFLGSVNIGVLVLGIVSTFFFWRKVSNDKKIILVWAFVCFASSVFLMNYRSSFLWSNLPLLPYFQFPWRFLMLTTFCIPIFVIALEKIRFEKFLPFGLIILTLVTTASYFRPQDFLGRTDGYFLNRYIPTPVASDEYKKTQEEYLRLPKNTRIRPDKNYPVAYIASDSGTINKIEKNSDFNVAVDISSSKGIVLNFSKYYFPGWVALIDSQRVGIQQGEPFAQISIQVPPGEHKVEFMFEETGFKKVLDAISFLSFLVSLWLVKNLWLRSKKIGPSF